MDRSQLSYGELQRKLAELEHQHESGTMEWREYRVARAELLAQLGGDDHSSQHDRGRILSFTRNPYERASRFDADLPRRRAA